jgi:hypothetical protein
VRESVLVILVHFFVVTFRSDAKKTNSISRRVHLPIRSFDLDKEIRHLKPVKKVIVFPSNVFEKFLVEGSVPINSEAFVLSVMVVPDSDSVVDGAHGRAIVQAIERSCNGNLREILLELSTAFLHTGSVMNQTFSTIPTYKAIHVLDNADARESSQANYPFYTHTNNPRYFVHGTKTSTYDFNTFLYLFPTNSPTAKKKDRKPRILFFKNMNGDIRVEGNKMHLIDQHGKEHIFSLFRDDQELDIISYLESVSSK